MARETVPAMRRLLLLVAMLALFLGLALPVSVAGASPGPAKALRAICEHVEGGTWFEGPFAFGCEGRNVEDTRAFDAVCEQAVHGVVVELLASPRPGEVFRDGWGCALPQP
jgi:hypothetical protein